MYNENYTNDSVVIPLMHVKAHALVPHLESKLSALCPPISTCRFKAKMGGISISITCSSCSHFGVYVTWGNVEGGIREAEAHVKSRQQLSFSESGSSKSTAFGAYLTASSTTTPDLKSIIDSMCQRHITKSSLIVKYTPIYKSRKCDLTCRDCPEWTFRSPASSPFSNEDITHYAAFRSTEKQHLQTEAHRMALRTRLGPKSRSANQGTKPMVSGPSNPKSISTSRELVSNTAKALDLKSSNILVTLRSRVQTSYPLMAAEVENAFRWFQRGQDADCVLCTGFVSHVINTNYTPASIKPPLFHVRAYTRVRETSQKLSELTTQSPGSALVAQLNGFTTEILCKQCPQFRFVVNDNVSKNLDAATSAARSHLNDPGHIARVRAANVGMPSSSTPQQRPDSQEQSPEAALFEACQEHFSSQASDIRKAFVKYTNGDIDCGECEAAFEQISALADDEAWVQHILDHMLGSSSQRDSDAPSQESSDSNSESGSDVEDTQKLPPTAKPEPGAILSPKKQPPFMPGPTIPDFLGPLRAKYPTSSFSMQRNERNEECFTCHDCSRTLSSGACIRNFEQHLGSSMHNQMVRRKEHKFSAS